MAATFVRNLMSHLATVGCSNFIPSSKKWSSYTIVSKCAQKFIDLLTMELGTDVHPGIPDTLLNKDCSSQYYFAGVCQESKEDTYLGRVRTNTLIDRKRSSLWTNNDSKEGICKGIRVKFARVEGVLEVTYVK